MVKLIQWATEQRNRGLPTVPSTIAEELHSNIYMRVVTGMLFAYHHFNILLFLYVPTIKQVLLFRYFEILLFRLMTLLLLWSWYTIQYKSKYAEIYH